MGEATGFFRHLRDFASSRERQGRGWTRLRTRLLVGSLVAFPLVVTVLVVRISFVALDRWSYPITRRLVGFAIPGLGAALTLLGLYLVGLLATNVVGGRVLGLFEAVISRVPLLAPIYQGARQVTEALQVRSADQFRRVVMVRFPSGAGRALGFVTRELREPSVLSPVPGVLVFVPTTPNPTSGFLLVCSLDEVEPLPVTVEEGIKLVISGGLIVPTRATRPPGGAVPRGG